MIHNNDFDIRSNLETVLKQFDSLFLWLTEIEHKTVCEEGSTMGNFDKYRRFSEYDNFIKPACDAEQHFNDGDYPQCAERCRNALEQFILYLYDKNQWNKPIGNHNPYKPSLDQLLKYKVCQNYLIGHKVINDTFFKKTGNTATHENYTQTNAIYAIESLRGLFYTINKCMDNLPFSGTQRFNESVYEDTPNEIIKPVLSLELNGKKISAPQNILRKAIIDRKLTIDLLNKNIAFINEPDIFGNTALSLAVYNQDYDSVQVLLEKGADPNFVFSKKFFLTIDKEIQKSYFKNFSYEFLNALSALINDIQNGEKIKNIDHIDIQTFIKKSHAILKMQQYSVEYIKYVKEVTSDNEIDWPKNFTLYFDKEYSTYQTYKNNMEFHNIIPLVIALKKDDPQICALLLRYSARTWDESMNYLYSYLQLPSECSDLLTAAVFYRAKKCTSKLLDEKFYDSEGNVIKVATDSSQKKLYDGSINLYGSIEGITPLMLAAEEDDYETVDDLLEKGAKVDALDGNGNSVFLHAVQNKRLKYTLKKLLKAGKATLSENEFKKIINHAGTLGCPISYINDENIADKFLEFGGDVNAKNHEGISCIIDTIMISPEMLPWMKRNGAKLNFKEFFYHCSYLPIIGSECNTKYSQDYLLNVLKKGGDFYTTEDLNILVPINFIPRITELIDAIILPYTVSVCQQLKNRADYIHRHPFIKEIKKYSNDGSYENESDALYTSQSSEKQNDRTLFIEEIQTAIKELEKEIPYEDLLISPLDDALIGKNYDLALFYITKGIHITELTKLLLVSSKISSDKETVWNQVISEIMKRNDVDFSDLLLSLCRQHPDESFDISEALRQKGINFYKFANTCFYENMFSPFVDFNYDNNKVIFGKNGETLSEEESRTETKKRNNEVFLNRFHESGFQEANIRLIKNSIIFGADKNKKDNSGKSALDYAREKGFLEVLK